MRFHAVIRNFTWVVLSYLFILQNKLDIPLYGMNIQVIPLFWGDSHYKFNVNQTTMCPSCPMVLGQDGHQYYKIFWMVQFI